MTDDPNTASVSADVAARDAEIADLESEMADTKGRSSDYYTNPGKQERWRQLMEAAARADARYLLDRGAGQARGDAAAPADRSAVDTEIAELEAMMADTKGPYWSGPQAAEFQARYRTLLESREGEPAGELIVSAQGMGLSETDAAVAVSVAERLEQALPAEVRADINDSLGQLPDAVRLGIVRELAAPMPSVPAATSDVVARFRDTEAGAVLLTQWGADGPRKLAQVKARWQRARNALDANGQGWLDWYVDHALQPGELVALLDVLAG